MERRYSLVNKERLAELAAVYRDGLLGDTLPFWIEHSVDEECGGFMFCLDRDGSVIDTDKGMWQNCRFTWLLATLFSTVERRPEWLELARHGADFIRERGFDADGRMFFLLTREGRPLRKRRYVYTEGFGAMALAAYARASGDESAAAKAIELAELVVRFFTEPGLIEAKTYAAARPMRSLGPLMMIVSMAQAVRENLGYEKCGGWIDRSLEEVSRYFLNREFKALMENVGPNGEFIDHLDGRLLSPPDAMELGWFILHEARLRGGDAGLIGQATTIIDWMWEIGWDREFGGIYYFRDARGLPPQEYWHDMKFWWCHNETIIANLLAFALTGEERFAERHKLAHDWSYAHFPDGEHGEWFGYLHRDGRLSVPLKGNWWKGPFHLPRMQWYCWQLLEGMLEGGPIISS